MLQQHFYGIESLLTDTMIMTGMRNAQIKPPSRLSQQLQKEMRGGINETQKLALVKSSSTEVLLYGYDWKVLKRYQTNR